MALIKRGIFIVTKSKFEDNAAKVMRTFFFAVLHYCRYLIPTNNSMAYKIILLGNKFIDMKLLFQPAHSRHCYTVFLVQNNKNIQPHGLQQCSFLSLLGDIFFDRQEYEDAKQVYTYVLQTRTELLHTEIHPLIAYSYNLLGLATSNTKGCDLKLCEIYFTKALGIYKSKCASQNNINIATVFENLGYSPIHSFIHLLTHSVDKGIAYY